MSTKSQIIDTVAKLLETQGYHATGLNQIVKESGAPRGSLYYYFPDGKEQLAAEAVADRGRGITQNMREQMARIDDPAEAIYQLMLSIAASVDAAKCGGGAPLANVALEASAKSERLREACRVAYQHMQQVVEQKLLTADYAPERAKRLSTTVVAAIDGGIILSRAEKSAEPLRQVAKEIKALLECAAKSES